MKKKNTGMKWIIAIVIIGLIAALMIPRLRRSKDVAGDEVEVKTGSIKTYYSFSGSIEAKNRQ
ncbi:MAG: RND transporter, partial [Tissierellia bacterium]|nr:RND transporter [Tissierellia bacterium]